VCAVEVDVIRNVPQHGQERDAGEEALSASGECARSRKKLIGSGLDVMKMHMQDGVHMRLVEKIILHWRRSSRCGAPLCAPSGVYSGTIWSQTLFPCGERMSGAGATRRVAGVKSCDIHSCSICKGFAFLSRRVRCSVEQLF
jgi:hypothetical protein